MSRQLTTASYVVIFGFKSLVSVTKAPLFPIWSLEGEGEREGWGHCKRKGENTEKVCVCVCMGRGEGGV